MADETTTLESIGIEIARERNKRGWTQAQLADMVGCSRRVVINAEKGVSITAVLLAEIAEAVGAGLVLRQHAHTHDWQEVCVICGERAS